ncbi:hypothetical protein AKJ54_00015 [candidate division MSBL1 archaeon SCGC-AAA382K21]|uniref:Inosine/uridine-preferring nucleoside hydrolase domain-containing protein n=1 Tax=candidate division MSBL1 archaeon SCGC-AAA382K21 TaxID=1698283 RepID=A0A133VMC8_9EURY|nr:hypothetical protein AKJ54_00015 [candidate division MSBL1 archaeon SCGC-AAA382K21]
MPKNVLLDVDTGVDDALAILLALASPELEVKGITTVKGNVEVEKVTRNTLNVLELSGFEEIPVAEGMSEPLNFVKKEGEIGKLNETGVEGGDYFHGKDGLGNSNLPDPKTSPVDESAVDFLIDSIRNNAGDLTLITTAPLTNIARAIQKDPEITNLVKEHVMMGGAYSLTPYGYGNVTPVSEFNIWADPLAADQVFCSDLPTVAVGLDVTQDPTVAFNEISPDYFSKENKIHEFVRSLISFYHEKGSKATYPHDPIAVSFAVDQEIFEWDDFHVRVETSGTIARGQTIVERRPEANLALTPSGSNPPNARVCNEIDGEEFVEMFMSRLFNMG